MRLREPYTSPKVYPDSRSQVYTNRQGKRVFESLIIAQMT